MEIRRALISVSDKTGVVDFARALSQLGVKIISTGGTARQLTEAGVEAIVKELDRAAGLDASLREERTRLREKLLNARRAWLQLRKVARALAERHGIASVVSCGPARDDQGLLAGDDGSPFEDLVHRAGEDGQ